MSHLAITSHPYCTTGKESRWIDAWQGKFQPVDMNMVLLEMRKHQPDRGYDQASSWWKQNSPKASYLGWVLLLLFIATSFGGIAIEENRSALVSMVFDRPVDQLPGYGIAVAFIAIGLGLVLSIGYYGIMLKYGVQQAPSVELEQVWTIDAEGVLLHDSRGQDVLRWSLFCGWAEHKTLFILLDVYGDWRFIPQSAFEEEQVDEVRSVIRQNVMKLKMKKRQ